MDVSDTSTATTAPRRPSTAWPLENALVSAAFAAQRLPWIDAPARALGLKPFTRRELTRQALAQMRRGASGQPVRLRTAFGTFLMPFSVDDAAALVARAQEAGARGRVTALSDEWRRSALTPHAAPDVALRTLRPRVRSVAAEEAGELLAARQADGVVTREDWCAVAQRFARRLVLGDAAADDTLIGDILDATLRSTEPDEHADRAAALRRRLDAYVHDADAAPALGDDEAVEHALEVVTRALTETAPQALALLTVRPPLPGADRVELTVAEALRRYPPLAATVHEVTAPFRWRDLTVEAGTDILRATSWLRDLDESDGIQGDEDGYGDGGVAEDPSASLCAAPEPCAAAELAVCAAAELVRALTLRAEPALRGTRLDPDALPHTLPPASLGIALAETESAPRAQDAGPEQPGTADGPAAGRGAAHYAALVSASARGLQEHARRLAECARQPGWNHDAFGEQCRMTLLAHAERCTRAAADARKAAEWLAH
ncbi:hypothetical protein [Streptomyces sp. NPDC052225]|uniref:hypothetical protein n=1 Tax=Streptomyces sp. NPDC052225 TaxID=3154949 RepID=UPI0034224627